MKIGIAGLGLIGGSMAKALKTNPENTVYGYDSDPVTLNFAGLYGAIDGNLSDEKISECDCLILCLYPEACVEFLKSAAGFIRSDALVVDCCGTKKKICEAGFRLASEHGFTFVGGHPMAGTHRFGFKYSSEDMFEDANMVLVPPVFDNMQLLERVKKVFEPCKFASFSTTTSEEHDRLIAFTSQMAHIVSNAYIKSPSAAKHRGISAGSYKDLTRVAWLNPEMWSDLFMENKENILSELDCFIDSVSAYRDAIRDNDRAALYRLLDEGRKIKQEVDG